MSAAGSTAGTAAVYAQCVATRGLGGSHRRILEAVPPGSRVLDVGCASGYLAALLSERGCTVVGFERDPAAAALAREHCEEVVVGDLESAGDREAIPAGFGVVVIGDVLEHLADPWGALRFVRGLLAPGGIVVVSIPNVAAWPVRLDLLRGSFDYAEFGILDRTHLRFFTRASARALVRDAGFVVEHAWLVVLERDAGRLRRALPAVAGVADRVLVHLAPGLFAQQFVFRLRAAA
jgi:2-polyprenyl-3-methyl-5-hydroxy-6-metoxy-1,4-benzoquinol methylase